MAVTQANHCIVLYMYAQIPDHQWPIVKATFIELGVIFYGFHNIWQVEGFEILINVQEYFSRWQRSGEDGVVNHVTTGLHWIPCASGYLSCWCCQVTSGLSTAAQGEVIWTPNPGNFSCGIGILGCGIRYPPQRFHNSANHSNPGS